MTVATSEIIDLGVLPENATDPIGPRFSPRMRRTLLAAATTMVCLLALVGSTATERGLTAPLWTGPVTLNGYQLGGDVLFSTSVDGHAITARDLRTGEQLWQHEVSDVPENTVDLGGGITAILTRELDATRGLPRGSTTFVRTRTGEEIGQIEGSVGAASVGGLPILIYSTRDDCPSTEMMCVTLSGWNAEGGRREVWRTELPPDVYALESFRGDLVDGLVTVAPDGTVELRDLASGSVLTSVALPELTVGGQLSLLTGVLVTAVRVGGGDTVALTGYERPSLTRIWSTEVSSVVVSEREYARGMWLGACGADVCLHGDDRGAWLIDPTTGTVKGRTALELVNRLGNGVFLARVPDSDPIGREPRESLDGIILDASMQVLAPLPVRDQVWWRDSDERALFTRTGPDRTGFLDVDPSGQQRLLGSVPGTDLTCEARGRYLACADAGGTLRVWRLPR